MDGVSFSPVSSLSPQHQAGNQICHYCTLLACYGNKARHMFLYMFVCVCVTAENWEERDEKRRWGSVSTRGTNLPAAIEYKL